MGQPKLTLTELFEKDVVVPFSLYPRKEFEFHCNRKWRFDYAWPDSRIAVELQGGIFGSKRTGHSSITGLLRDMEKYNHAMALGWRVFLFNRKDIEPCLSTSIEWFLFTVISSKMREPEWLRS